MLPTDPQQEERRPGSAIVDPQSDHFGTTGAFADSHITLLVQDIVLVYTQMDCDCFQGAHRC